MPKVATSVQINPDSQGRTIMVDGAEFPWHVDMDFSITPASGRGGLNLVHFALLVDGPVEVTEP